MEEKPLREKYEVELGYLAHASWQTDPVLKPLDDPVATIQGRIAELTDKLHGDGVLDQVWRLRMYRALNPDSTLTSGQADVVEGLIVEHGVTLDELERLLGDEARAQGRGRESKKTL